MILKNIELENFRGIEKMSLSFTKKTTAILGVNGVGKSTVLDALAIALSNMTERIVGNAAKARDISPDDIKVGKKFSRLKVEVDLGAELPTSWAIARNKKANERKTLERSSDFSALNPQAALLNARMLHREEQNQPISLPLAVYYDVHRAVLDVPLRVRAKLKNTPREAYHDALGHGGTDFRGFFGWFRDREDAENERIRDDSAYRDRDLSAVRHAIETFTKFTDLRIRRKPSLRMTVKKGSIELNVMQLSDGEKCLLALVGDLARRLSLLNTEKSNPLTGEGIILIDEIDLHLHPKWQRTIVSSLENTFPNCQFVITTHSPQVVGELVSESVMLLREGVLLGHAERAMGMSSSSVLEELMESSARDPEVAESLAQITKLIDDDKLAEAQNKLNDLKIKVGDIPEVLEAQSSISSLELMGDVD
jgi:predicted ATP-binding protein involved in virulence